MREVREISIEQIHPNRHQPRLEFNEDALMELAQSIREISCFLRIDTFS